MSPELLRNVRTEIQDNLSFTPKETDIYKIHQSGDLANLDGLDDSSLKLLPSLLTLRDALYSSTFRDYLSTITGAGALSGRKTDMAINVYTPGCHLLCHDDVIGSRRVSYILYLTDPDIPWKEEWGGALRLYPIVEHTSEDGKVIKVPSPDHDLSIPPAFNQLSFFAVQPGESFHDVEEVYASKGGDDEANDDVRVRTAISGWYHIPQEGEEGFVRGLEETLAEKSSLMQLQGKEDLFDLPKQTLHSANASFNSDFSANDSKEVAPPATPEDESRDDDNKPASNKHADVLSPEHGINKKTIPSPHGDALLSKTAGEAASVLSTQDEAALPHGAGEKKVASTQDNISVSKDAVQEKSSRDIKEEIELSEADLTFLLKYIAPTYLTPDTLESVSTLFSEQCFLTLSTFLSSKFSNSLRDFISIQESQPLPTKTAEIEKTTPWAIARPPHKHRYLFQQGREGHMTDRRIQSPLQDLLENLLPSLPFFKWLHFATGLTISSHNILARRFRRGKDYTLATGYDEEDARLEITLAITPTPGWESEESADGDANTIDISPIGGDVGGYVTYMAGDEDSDEDKVAQQDLKPGLEILPSNMSNDAQSSTASNPILQKARPKADPAIYQAPGYDDIGEDAVLFSMPAGWNTLGIVLRDKGTMRFVKYISRQAKGDRWDICGEFGVLNQEDDEDEDEEGIGEKVGGEESREGEEGVWEIEEGSVESDDSEDSETTSTDDD